MKIRTQKNKVVLARVAPVLSVVTVGLLFLSLVITQHVPQSTLMGKVTYLTSHADSQLLVATPNPVKVCNGSGAGNTTLSWNIPATTQYELHKGGQAGALVLQGMGEGSVQVTGVTSNTQYVLVGITTATSYQWQYNNRKWVRVPVSTTSRDVLAILNITTTNQGCTVSASGPLSVRVSKSLIEQLPGYYFLYASWLDGTNRQPFSGTLDYNLTFCPETNLNQCSEGTGTWLTVSNGAVRADLPAGQSRGVYRAKFRPHGSNWPWSNTVQVNVGYSGDLESMAEYWLMPNSGVVFEGENNITNTNYRAVVGYEPYTAACKTDPADTKTMYFIKDSRFGYWGPSYDTQDDKSGTGVLRWHLVPWRQNGGWHDAYLTALGHETYMYNPASLSLDDNFKDKTWSIRYGSDDPDFPGYVLAPYWVAEGWGIENWKQTYPNSQETSAADICNRSAGYASGGHTGWLVNINKVQLNLPKYSGPAMQIKFWEGPIGRSDTFMFVENWYFVKNKGLIRIEANAYDQKGSTRSCVGDPDCFVNETMEHPMNILTLSEYMH